jgi:diguanylate cyclase (GGDEF)-like protein
VVNRQSKKEELWSEVERLRQSTDEHRNRAAVLHSESQELREENHRLARAAAFTQELSSKVQAQNEKLEILTSLTKELASFDLDGVLEVSVKRIPYLVGARYASVFLYDREANRLVLKQHTHEHDIDHVVELSEVPNSLMAVAVRTQRTLCIDDLGRFVGGDGAAPPRPHQSNYQTSSCVVAPLIAAGTVEGVLNLADRFDHRPFSAQDQLKMIEQACELVAVSLRNARLFDAVQRAARSCSLTGLRNHQAFAEILEVEVRRATRYENVLALVVFKLHGVGLLNANHGHQAGDQLLQAVADRLQANIRDVDVAGRTGGTEFGIILPEQGTKGALVVANRLVELLAALDVRIGEDRAAFRVTFGVVEFESSRSGPELMGLALGALQGARKAGKPLGIHGG